jgi:hypothetical protein
MEQATGHAPMQEITQRQDALLLALLKLLD